MENPAHMPADQLRETMYDLARHPGEHEIHCQSHDDAVKLRLRMNRVRSTDRIRVRKLREEQDPELALLKGDAFELDRLVLTIEGGSSTIVVVVTPSAVARDFIFTRKEDGTKELTFNPEDDLLPKMPVRRPRKAEPEELL